MKKVIEKKLTISANNRDVDRLYQEFYSKDKGIAEFKFTVDNLTATKVICLFYFRGTKRYQEVDAAIEDNSFTVQFDTSLITTDETVIGYIYCEKVEQSADVYSFLFNVHVSEIDKAVKTPLIERETGRIVNVKDVVTKQELDALFEKIKAQGGTYDDSNLRTEISNISADIEALKTKPDNDTIYNDKPLVERVVALENKPNIDTSQFATKLELQNIALTPGPKGDKGDPGPPGTGGTGGTGGSVDLSKYALKTDLNAYLSRNDASRDYVTKGWSTQTFAFKNELGGFIRKNEVGQYALTPGDASARYVNKIEGRAFAKREDIDNIANEIKKYLVDNGITSTGSGLANVIIDFFKEIDKRTK